MDIFEKYSKDEKKKISKDWESEFPYLLKYKKMDFYNRLGPMIIGTTLELDNSGLSYKPIYHVHNLCRVFPAITLTLVVEGNMIKPSEHDTKLKEVANNIAERAFIPLNGDEHIDNVIKAYEKYSEYPNLGNFIEFEDLVLTCAWYGDDKKTGYALSFVRSILIKWPEERYFKGFGGFSKWFEQLETIAKNTEAIRKICE